MLDCVVVSVFYFLVLPKVLELQKKFFLFFKLLIFFPMSEPFDFISPHRGEGGNAQLYTLLSSIHSMNQAVIRSSHQSFVYDFFFLIEDMHF